MWRRLKNTSATPARLEKFRKFRQHVKNWIRFERKKYLTEIANEVSTNAKRFWFYFSLKNGRKSVPDKVVYQGLTIYEDRARAEAFNNYFQSVFKDHSDCQEDEVPLIIADSRLGLKRFQRFQRFLFTTCTSLHKKNEYKNEKKVEETGFTTLGG